MAQMLASVSLRPTGLRGAAASNAGGPRDKARRSSNGRSRRRRRVSDENRFP